MERSGATCVKKPGGYRVLRFVNPLPDKYKCPVCNFALRDPQQTFCGHRVCSTCITITENGRSTGEFKCPVCNEVPSKQYTFQDKVALREVLDLLCYCPAEARGCSWRGELRNLDEHQQTCEFELISCKNKGCIKEILRKNLDRHIQENCSYRKVKCEFCNEKKTKHILQEHYQLCSFYPVVCRNNCGKTDIPRKNLDEHIAKECQNAENNCRFSTSGCIFVGSKKKMKQHMREMQNRHAEMAAETINKQQVQIVEITEQLERCEQRVNATETNINEKETIINDLGKTVSNMQEKFQTLDQELQRIKSEKADIDSRIRTLEKGRSGGDQVTLELQNISKLARKCEQKVAAMESQIKEPSTQFSRDSGMASLYGSSLLLTSNVPVKLNGVETQLAMMDVHLAELNLKLQLMEASSYSGCLLWKIDTFTRRRQEAITGKTPSLYSPPFFTSRFGYKMCMRVYLNGDGVGKGSHVSLFFVVMRGEYDGLLTWPFRQKITMTLIDQTGSNNDIEESFNPDQNSSSFKRPSRDMNVASGCPLFVHKDRLAGNYVKDDSIFIRLKVNTDGISLFE